MASSVLSMDSLSLHLPWQSSATSGWGVRGRSVSGSTDLICIAAYSHPRHGGVGNRARRQRPLKAEGSVTVDDVISYFQA
jgi:hypothetical protein